MIALSTKRMMIALSLLALCILPARSDAISSQPDDPNARIQAEISSLRQQAGDLYAAGQDINALQTRIDELYAQLPPPERGRDGTLDQGGETCATATTIIVLPFCDEGTTYWYADNYTPTCGPSGGRDVVYRYRPMLSQTVTISLCGSYFNTILHVWRGCPDAGGVMICCNDNTSCAPYGTASCCLNVTLTSLPVGQYYYFIVDGAGAAAAGHYIINVMQNTSTCYDAHCAGTPPPNDLCDNATLLPNLGGAQWVAGYTIGATLDATPVCNAINQAAPGVWYRIIGNGTTYTVTTCDPATDYDTRLSVFCGTCAELICVTANDNFNVPVCGPTSQVQWCTEPNREYYILVHGATNIEVGRFRLGYWTDGALCSTPPVCSTVPPNDLCANATLLTTPGAAYSVQGTTVGATNDNAPCCLNAQTAPGVWYRIIGNGTTLTLSTCNQFTANQNWDTKLSVYCNTCTDLRCVDGNNDDVACNWPGLSTVRWCSVAGEEYFVLVHGQGNAVGAFALDVSSDNATCNSSFVCVPPVPPPNDDCVNAIQLAGASTAPQSIRGSTIGASADNAPFCDVADVAAGVWFKLIGDGHNVWMTTCNEITQCLGYDTRISVYCGPCDALMCVQGNDDLPPCPPMSEVIWCTEVGREYYILVHGAAGSAGDFQLDWWEDPNVCDDPVSCTATGDSCRDAMVVPGLPFCDESTTWWYADNYTPTCGEAGGRDRVYRYTPVQTEMVSISLCGSYFNTVLHVWLGCPDEGGQMICCNNDFSCAINGTQSCCPNLTLMGHATYYIIVDGNGPNAAGHYILNITPTSSCIAAHCPGTPPPNDLCANAITLLNPGGAQWLNGWTIGATLDTTPVCNNLSQVAPGVWYRIIGNGTTYTVTTCDMKTDYDTRLSVFCASCSNLMCVTANDNFNIPVCGQTSLVEWCTELNREYYILVHGAQPWEVGHFRLGYWTDGTACTTPPDCNPVPPNDLCVNAINIPAPGNGYCVQGTTVGAMVDNAPCCVTAQTAPGVWYKLTGNGTTITATTCNLFTSNQNWNTKLSVYCGSCPNLICVDGNDDYAACAWPGGLSQVSWCAENGEEYYILVHGSGNATGIFSLDMSSDNLSCTPDYSCDATSISPNDLCVNAIPLAQANPVPHHIRGSTIGATLDNAPFCEVADIAPGVWYTLIGDGHRVTMTTCNEFTECTGFDTRLSVYCGDCGNLTCVTGNDNWPNCALMSEVIWCAEAGREYYILVHGGVAGAAGDFQLDWWDDGTECTDPSPCVATGDSCADAIIVDRLPFCAEGTTWWYADNYTPACADVFGGRDRVYKIRLTYSEQVTVSLCGSYFDTVLHIWLDCPGQGGTMICCNNNMNCALDGRQSCCQNVVLMANRNYYIIVDGNGPAAAGHYILNILQSDQCPVTHCHGNPPPNDTCAAAILLTSPADTGQWVTGWTIGATLDVTPVCSGLAQVSPGVWYKIVGNGTPYTVTTCDPGTDFDTWLTVFSGRCDSLVCVKANDNFNIPVCGMTSLVQWCANLGETYYILVHGAFWYEVGHFRLGWWHEDSTCTVPPTGLVIYPVDPGIVPYSATQVRLNWNPVLYANRYHIYRDSTVNIQLVPANLIGITADTTFVDSLGTGPKYFYTVMTSNP